VSGHPRLGALPLLSLAVLTWASVASAAPTPTAAARQFAEAILARDYAAAYDLIAPSDRGYKSREDYLRENEPLTGFVLQLTRELARLIRDERYQVESDGDRARVVVKWSLPDANAPAVTRLVEDWDTDKLNALGPPEQARLVAALRDLAREGRIPFLEAEDRFEVVREGGEWCIRMTWARIELHGRPVGGRTPLEWGVDVTVRDQHGKPVEQAEVVLGAHMPLHPWHHIPPIRLKPGAPGVYTGGLTFEMPGEWVLQVAVFGPATGSRTVTLEVPASGGAAPAVR